MLEMVRDINAKFGGGKTHVTCWTCHRVNPTGDREGGGELTRAGSQPAAYLRPASFDEAGDRNV